MHSEKRANSSRMKSAAIVESHDIVVQFEESVGIIMFYVRVRTWSHGY